MNKRSTPFQLVASFAALTLLISTSDAHHSAVHDQNPNPPPALGATTVLHFEAGSLIIPMDGCYARMSFLANTDLNQIITPLTIASAKCNATSEKDDGVIPAYTLMFRLIQAGIPVNWVIKSGKTSFHSIDFSVVAAAGSPVHHREPGGSTNTTKYSGLTTISYRGAPFVIDADHADAALDLMDSLEGTCVTGTCYDEVDIHISTVSFDAPVYRTVDSLPKLAVIDATDAATELQNEKTAFLKASIEEALMEDLEGTLWDWVTIPEANAGGLADYDLAWVPPFELKTGEEPTDAQKEFYATMAEFADGGGSVLWQDGAISGAEGWGDQSAAGPGAYDEKQEPVEDFMSNGGIVVNGVTSSWDNGTDSEGTVGQDYSDPASQFGGMVWTGIGGSKYNWKPRYDFAYHDGVRRMIYTKHTTDDTKSRWDLATWRKKDNDSAKGTIYYLGGYNWRRVTASGFRVLMNTLLTTVAGEPDTVLEIARSSPTIATVAGTETQYAGTLEVDLPPTTAPAYASAADEDGFIFPWQRGHMRALDVGALTTGETEFEDLGDALLWDAADLLPSVNYAGAGCGTSFVSSPADGTCRRIFTDTVSGDTLNETFLVTDNSATLKASLGVDEDAEADFLIGRIHAGSATDTAVLGGVDRSTVAVIEPSPLISNGRATIAYFGATDGMLHAVCTEIGPGCPAAGVELWAYLPSSELGHVRLNSTRIDGSPKVADVFGRFTTAREYRTVLVFQTGNTSPSATYALDITDPTNPDVIWKYTTSGPGTGVAMGWVTDNATVTPMVFVQSALSPDGTSSGYDLAAIETVTGDVRWTKSFVYPAARNVANNAPPLTAIPGGVTILPTESATVDSLLVPTIYGQVYRLDPLNGDNVYGGDSDTSAGTAMFDFGEDFHPIGASVALYRGQDDGVLRALVVSGGFADPYAPSATEWAPDDISQYAVGFPALTDDVPVTRAEVEADSTLGIHIDFGAGQRAFSAATVAGDEVFITTDTSAVNASDYGSSGDTGRLWRKDLSSAGTASYVAVPSGAAAVDVSVATGTVLSGGFNSVQVTKPAGFDAAGITTEAVPDSSSTRRLWLRTQ